MKKFIYFMLFYFIYFLFVEMLNLFCMGDLGVVDVPVCSYTEYPSFTPSIKL